MVAAVVVLVTVVEVKVKGCEAMLAFKFLYFVVEV